MNFFGMGVIGLLVAVSRLHRMPLWLASRFVSEQVRTIRAVLTGEIEIATEVVVCQFRRRQTGQEEANERHKVINRKHSSDGYLLDSTKLINKSAGKHAAYTCTREFPSPASAGQGCVVCRTFHPLLNLSNIE